MNTINTETRTVRVVCASAKDAERFERALKALSEQDHRPDLAWEGIESITRYVPAEAPVPPCNGTTCAPLTATPRCYAQSDIAQYTCALKHGHEGAHAACKADGTTHNLYVWAREAKP